MKYYNVRCQPFYLAEDGCLRGVIKSVYYSAHDVESVLERAEEIDDIVSFLKHRIINLNASIKHLKEYLPYADGQSYYRDKDKIVEQEREIERIERYLAETSND